MYSRAIGQLSGPRALSCAKQGAKATKQPKTISASLSSTTQSPSSHIIQNLYPDTAPATGSFASAFAKVAATKLPNSASKSRNKQPEIDFKALDEISHYDATKSFGWKEIMSTLSELNNLRFPEDSDAIIQLINSTRLSSNRLGLLLKEVLRAQRNELFVFLCKHLLQSKDRFYVSSALRVPLARLLEKGLTTEVESVLRSAPAPPSAYGTDPYSLFLKSSFSDLLLSYVSSDEAQKALALYKHVTKCEIPISTEALNQLGVLVVVGGDLKEANRIFEMLVSMGKNLSPHFCAHLIAACEISGDSRNYVGDSFESIAVKSGVSRDALDAALLEAFIKFGLFDRAWALKLDLDKRGISPNLTLLAYTRLRASRVKAGDYLGAWKLLEDMATLTHSKIHDTSFIEVLEMAADRGDSAFVKALCRKYESERGHFLSKPFYSCLVMSLSKSADMLHEEALTYLKMWRETTTKPDRPELKDYVTILLNISSSSVSIDDSVSLKCIDTIKQWMYEEGLLSSVEWNSLIEQFVWEGKQAEAEQTIILAPKLGANIDTKKSLMLILDSYKEEGKQDEMMRLAQKMDSLMTDDYSWHLNLMVQYFEMQDERKARKHLDKIISIATAKPAAEGTPSTKPPLSASLMKKILKTLHTYYTIDSVISFWRLCRTDLNAQMRSNVYIAMMQIMIRCKDKAAATEVIFQAIDRAQTHPDEFKINRRFCSTVLFDLAYPQLRHLQQTAASGNFGALVELPEAKEQIASMPPKDKKWLSLDESSNSILSLDELRDFHAWLQELDAANISSRPHHHSPFRDAVKITQM